MKKSIFILIVIVLVGSLLGCSQNEPTNQEEEEAKNEVVEWPTKDITIIVPYGAGGSTDLNIRSITDSLTEQLGVNVVVLNREGGGGSVGAAECANAKPDGYTYTVANGANMSVVPRMSDIGYTYESFEPISHLSLTPLGLAVYRDFPADTLEEYIQWAKDNPGDLRFSSAGANSTQQLTMNILSSRENFEATHVVNNGAGPAMAACLGKHVESVLATTTDLLPNYESGDLKILCVFADERVEEMPDVPTSKELGYDGLGFGIWYAIVGPDGVSEEIVEKFDSAIGNALNSEKVKDAYEKLGIKGKYMDHKELAESMKNVDKMFGEVLDNINQ